MKLDTWIRKLIPRDDRFFVHLEASSRNLVESSEVLQKLFRSRKAAQREALTKRIRELEHTGDVLTHNIYSELNSTFVTPLDREDIHRLASSLDDILDHLDNTVMKISMYRLRAFTPAMNELGAILSRSIVEVHTVVTLLRALHDTEKLAVSIRQINELENEADDLLEVSMGELFRGKKNATEIMKLKEVYEGLEKATDRCEDVANVVEGILLKNA